MAKREKIVVEDVNAEEETLTVVTYNILADCHVDFDMEACYQKCEKRDLYISGRFDAIVAEVEAYEPDIVCFQEVPPDYYKKNFQPHFEKLGFKGLYIKRIRETHEEGEATFYKSSKLELVDSVSQSLLQLIKDRLPSGDAPSLSSAAMDYISRPDVTIVTHFRSRASGKEFVVANVHISFVGYTLRDLQALQTTTVLKTLTDMARTEDGKHLSHIILGDFNQQPESPGYRILEKGELPAESRAELESCRFIGGDVTPTGREKNINASATNGDETAPRTGLLHLLGDDFFRHSSPGLKSAYFTALRGNEPGVTCIDLEKEEFKQTLDYIWFSDASLKLKSVVDVPSVAQIDAEVAFPSQKFPSDHLSLCATLAFK